MLATFEIKVVEAVPLCYNFLPQFKIITLTETVKMMRNNYSILVTFYSKFSHVAFAEKR